MLMLESWTASFGNAFHIFTTLIEKEHLHKLLYSPSYIKFQIMSIDSITEHTVFF